MLHPISQTHRPTPRACLRLRWRKRERGLHRIPILDSPKYVIYIPHYRCAPPRYFSHTLQRIRPRRRRILAQGSLATAEVHAATQAQARGVGLTAPTTIISTSSRHPGAPSHAHGPATSATASGYSSSRYTPASSIADNSAAWTGRERSGGAGGTADIPRQHPQQQQQPHPTTSQHLYASQISNASSEFPRALQPRASPIPTKPDLIDLQAGGGRGRGGGRGGTIYAVRAVHVVCSASTHADPPFLRMLSSLLSARQHCCHNTGFSIQCSFPPFPFPCVGSGRQHK